jgi:hypothetical protein
MATLVLSLSFTSDSDVDNHTIYDSPDDHPFTYRKVTPADTCLAVYLATSLQHEGIERGYPAKQPKNNV